MAEGKNETVTAAGTSEGAKKGWEGRAHGGHIKLTDGRFLELRRTTNDPENFFKFRLGNEDEIGEKGAENFFKSSGHGEFLRHLRSRGYNVHKRDEGKVKEFFEGSEAPKESEWDKHYREAQSKASSSADLDTVKAKAGADDAVTAAGTKEGAVKGWATRRSGGGPMTHSVSKSGIMHFSGHRFLPERATDNLNAMLERHAELTEKIKPAFKDDSTVPEDDLEKWEDEQYKLEQDIIAEGRGRPMVHYFRGDPHRYERYLKEHRERRAQDIRQRLRSRASEDKSDDPDAIHCRSAAGVALAAPEPWRQDEPVKFVYAPEGVHTITAGFRDGRITLTVVVDEATPAALQASFASVAAKRSQTPFADEEHEAHKATLRFPKDGTRFEWGQVKDATGVVLAGGLPTSYGAEAVNGRTYESWSPEFLTDADYGKAKVSDDGHYTFPDGVRGSASNPARLVGVGFTIGALTNKPAFHMMPPVKAGDAAKAGDETVTAAWSDAAREAALESRRSKAKEEGWDENRHSSEAHKASARAYESNTPQAHREAAWQHELAQEAHQKVKSPLHSFYRQMAEHHHASAYMLSQAKASEGASADSATVTAAWSDAARRAALEARKAKASRLTTLADRAHYHAMNADTEEAHNEAAEAHEKAMQVHAEMKEHPSYAEDHEDFVNYHRHAAESHRQMAKASGIFGPSKGSDQAPTDDVKAASPGLGFCKLAGLAAGLQVAHWAADTVTNAHKAIGDLYETVSAKVDEFAEVYSGKTGEVPLAGESCEVRAVGDHGELIEQGLGVVDEVRAMLSDGDDDLLNILADVEAAYNKARYLLKAADASEEETVTMTDKDGNEVGTVRLAPKADGETVTATWSDAARKAALEARRGHLHEEFNEWHGYDEPTEKRHVEGLVNALAWSPGFHDKFFSYGKPARKYGGSHLSDSDAKVLHEEAKEWSGKDAPNSPRHLQAMHWASSMDEGIHNELKSRVHDMLREFHEAHPELEASDASSGGKDKATVLPTASDILDRVLRHTVGLSGDKFDETDYAVLAKQADDQGREAAAWVADAGLWRRAKDAVLAAGRRKDDTRYWPDVMAHYRKLGGRTADGAKAEPVSAADALDAVLAGKTAVAAQRESAVDAVLAGKSSSDGAVDGALAKVAAPQDTPERILARLKPVVKATWSDAARQASAASRKAHIKGGAGFEVGYDFARARTDTEVHLAPEEYAKPGHVIGYIKPDPESSLGFMKRASHKHPVTGEPAIRVHVRKDNIKEDFVPDGTNG